MSLVLVVFNNFFFQEEAEQVEKDHAEELERIAANHERVRRAVEKL